MAQASSHDVSRLRELVEIYAELAAQPVQQQRRDRWRAHYGLQDTPLLIQATYGMWNMWCRDFFGDHTLQCTDPFFREHERNLLLQIWHDSVGDDFILEPWLTQKAVHHTPGGWCGPWGVTPEYAHSEVEGGAFKVTSSPIKEWGDLARLTVPHHQIDEQATAEQSGRLQDAVGDLITIDLDRGPMMTGFYQDIATSLAYLRGLEQFMLDMYESPRQFHELLAFMRDGILQNQSEGEAAGDFSLTGGQNQAMTYATDLPDPQPNSGPCRRSDLWGFFAAQEYTLISPQFHDEFLYQYQLPIMAHWGLTHYGCCEDLTRKIEMLRQAPNLRSIAIAPVANIARCAEQIQRDYVMSWRPNPTEMVATDFNESRIRQIIGDGLRACQGGVVNIHLKDIETVQGEPERLARWVQIVREVSEQVL